MKAFELVQYMNTSIERLVKDVVKSTFHNLKETTFLLKYAKSIKTSSQKRLENEKVGQHIPSFLISSITGSCNLFCKGCYARANGICGETRSEEGMTASQWRDVFEQARGLGIAFNILAGGEPLLRKDVITEAACVKDVIFAVFTNGTLIDDFYLNLFDRNRNIVPVLSLEGDRKQTEARRGDIYDNLMAVIERMDRSGILFGTSITVTSENLDSVTSSKFVGDLYRLGCRLVFFIEYVPVEKSTETLALSEMMRVSLENRQNDLRKQYPSMVFMSFPGDEKHMGGCLAAGRGFFHINSNGSAEPCPFSPYSDMNVKDSTLLECLKSPLFNKLKEGGLVGGEHNGGCVLFENREAVEQLLGNS